MGGARKISNILGLSLLLVACMFALGPAIGIGGQQVSKNAYEVGSANTTPTQGHVGDTMRIEGTGMVPNADMVVLFGVRIDEVSYIAYAGDTHSDSAGNWSCNKPIPSTVQAYNVSSATMYANGTTGAARMFWERDAVPAEAAEEIIDGTEFPVIPGYYQFAGVTEGVDGGLYGTNTNWVEVSDYAADDAGSSPSGTTYSSSVGNDTSNAVLPNTGFPAALCGLAGAASLAAGVYFRNRLQKKDS